MFIRCIACLALVSSHSPDLGKEIPTRRVDFECSCGAEYTATIQQTKTPTISKEKLAGRRNYYMNETRRENEARAMLHGGEKS